MVDLLPFMVLTLGMFFFICSKPVMATGKGKEDKDENLGGVLSRLTELVQLPHCSST